MKIIQIIIIALLLAACGQKAATVKKYYRLTTEPTTAFTKQIDSTLWIKRPEAHSILGNRPMVATDEAGALQQLSHHAWIESPKILLQELLANHAQSQWDTVTSERPKDVPYHQLHSRITAFEKNNNVARISMQFTLIDQEGVLIKQQSLSATQEIIGNSYADFASAMGQAFTQLLSQLELIP